MQTPESIALATPISEADQLLTMEPVVVDVADSLHQIVEQAVQNTACRVIAVVEQGQRLVGSAALLMFEAEAPNSQITDYAEALWWATATLTTVGAASEPVTLGGRIVALLLMLGGLVLLGYVAGVLAAVLFGRRDGEHRQASARRSSR